VWVHGDYLLSVWQPHSLTSELEAKFHLLQQMRCRKFNKGGFWAKNLLIFSKVWRNYHSWNSFFVGAYPCNIWTWDSGKCYPKSICGFTSQIPNLPWSLFYICEPWRQSLATLFGKEAMSWLCQRGRSGDCDLLDLWWHFPFTNSEIRNPSYASSI